MILVDILYPGLEDHATLVQEWTLQRWLLLVIFNSEALTPLWCACSMTCLDALRASASTVARH